MFWQLVTTKREFDFRLFRLSYSDSIIEEKGSPVPLQYIILLSKSAFDHES